MAYDIGPVIGIEGEKEFRNSIKQINDNMKTLGTEMKAVASQFDKNDNSTEALTSKNKVLNKQIDEQKNKLSELEKGLASATEKYGENDKVTQGWKRSVNQATADLNNMERELKNNTDAMEKAKNPADDLGKEIKEVGNNADDAGQKTFKLGDLIKANLISEAIISGVKALGNAMKSVVTGTIDMAKEAAAYADDMLTLSDTTGMSTESLQAYNYAAELVDVSMETLTGSMSKNVKAMSNARNGSKAFADAYKKLGISVTDSNGQLRDSETVYWETIDALGKITNETERDALAMQIFGKSARELNPLIKQGSAGIAELTEEAKKMGAVMSDENLQNLGGLDDALQRLNGSMSSIKNSIGAVAAPALAELAEAGAKYIGGFSKEIQGANGDMGKIGEIIGTTLSDLVVKIAEKMPEIMKGARSLLSAFGKGIMDNLPEIIRTGTAIVMDLLKGLIQALPEIIKCGLEVIVALALGIADALPELIPTIVETVLTIVETLIDNIDKLIDAAIAIIMALAEGLIEALPILIEKTPIIIENLIIAITDNLPKLIEMGILLTVKLAVGLIKAIPQLLKAIPKIIEAIVKGFANHVNNMADIGKNLVKGIWDGINGATTWLLDKIIGFGNTILSGIKGVFGIHSPSKVFKDEVGKNLALGLGMGFTDEMEKVSASMAEAIPINFNTKLNLIANLERDSRVFGGMDGLREKEGSTGKSITQTVNIYSPTALSPAEVARQNKRVLQELALQL